MEFTDVALRAHAPCGHHHAVEFYETEAFLVDTVCTFLVPALARGHSAIVVATAAHRRMFESALGAAGIDVDAAIDDGRYLTFDAAELLTRFMVEEHPDPVLFRETVGAAMDRAGRHGGEVRVYGEMVALLWDAGDAASALALEDLWNDLAHLRTFALLCAYPMRAFDDEASTPAFGRICRQHSAVIPGEGYSLLTSPAERSRAVAQLQQQNTALRAELERLRAQRERGEMGVRRDEAGAQRDQAGVERDEAGVHRDQAGLHRDQAGLHRDRVGTHRDEAGVQRDEAGVERDEAGLQRDRAGVRRDRAADERDQAADERDEVAQRSEASNGAGSAADALDRSAVARREAASDRRRASRDRRAGISERTEAESDRVTALADRQAGAHERAEAGLDRGTALADRGTALADRGAGAIERTEAELDRGSALADRGASATDRVDSSQDDLTGAYQRGAGFVELARDIERARRSQQPLVLGFIDVDGLKGVNDSLGHAAGDRMLSEVARTLRAQLRGHDLIIRYGGDEFLCVISGLNLADAATRLARFDAALARAPEHASVTVGLAELRPGDAPEDLVARADAALYRQRQRLRPRPA